MGNEIIYVLDEITPKAGQGRALFDHYMEAYAPVARARGLKLEHAWVNPPVWLEGEQLNVLYFVWSVVGVAGYWGVEAKARWDETSSDFWRDIEPMITARRRSVLAEAADLAGLANV